VSIDLTEPTPTDTDPRAQYMAALAVAEQLIAYAPALPLSLDVRAYGPWKYGTCGLSLHFASRADVTVFLRWAGAEIESVLREDGMVRTGTPDPGGVYQDVPFEAWALHTGAAPVEQQAAPEAEQVAEVSA